jgi:hypothetical protein
MCDLTSYADIQDLCAERVERGEMLTALDLCAEARHRGITETFCRLEDAVDEYYACGAMGPDYTRTLITIPGADEPMWLYHRWEDDLRAYQPVERESLKETLPAPSRRGTICDRPRWQVAHSRARANVCPRCARRSLARLLLARVLRWF